MDINNEEYHRQDVSLQQKLHHCHRFVCLTIGPPFLIVKPWPQTLSPKTLKTQKLKTKGPRAYTKISWAF